MPRKKRAQTNIERYGFKDSDLTTPGHDAICIWVEDNIEAILPVLLRRSTRLTPSQLEHAMGEYQLEYYRTVYRGTRRTKEEEKHLEEKMYKYLQELEISPLEVLEVTWEPVLLNKKEYEVGFLDLMVKYKYPEIGFHEEDNFVLIAHESWVHTKLWFEIKTTIPSLGELFRQLSFYKNHVTEPIVVVSPDTRHKDRIQSQWYPFMAIPPSVLKKVKKEKPPQEESPPTFQTETSSTTVPPTNVKQVQTLQLPFAGKKD